MRNKSETYKNSLLTQLLGSLMLLAGVFVYSGSSSQVLFQDMSDSLGINFDHGRGITVSSVDFGGGVSFFDFNKDGWDDLTFTSLTNEDIQFYQNTGSGFIKLSPLVNFKAETKQAVWVDIDNDGDNDLFVTSVDSGNRLYENTGGMVMKDITRQSRIDTTTKISMTANWGDYNEDGLLDLYVCNFNGPQMLSNDLYRNEGNNVFTNVTRRTLVYDSSTYSMASAMFDYDNDGDLDIYATSDFNFPNRFFENRGGTRFLELAGSINANILTDAMSVTVGDYNNDLDLDVHISNTATNNNRLLAYQDNNQYMDSASFAGTQNSGWGWGANFLDADNDGDLDLYVSAAYSEGTLPSHRSTFFENQGNATFLKPLSIGMDGDTIDSHTNAIADFNRDGKVDIAVSNQDSTVFLWENRSSAGNYISVELEGTESNRMGISSRILVYTKQGAYLRYTLCGESLKAQNSGYEVIGLDTTTVIDSLVVEWINGHKDVFDKPPVNQRFSVREGGGSPLHTPIYVNDSVFSAGEVGYCKGDTLILSTRARYDHIRWSTGDTTGQIEVDTPGTYVREAWVNGGPRAFDSIRVYEYDFSSFSIGPVDTAFCTGNKLRSNLQAENYFWSTGATSRSIQVFTSGLYSLTIQSFLCTATDQVDVTIYEADKMSLGNDTTICEGKEVILSPSGNWAQFDWSDGSTDPTLTVTDSGIYSVIVTDSNGCSRFDQIEVGLKICNSIDEWISDQGISVFPNPATTEINIRISRGGGSSGKSKPELYILEVYSIEGKRLLRETIKEGLTQIETRDWLPGLYRIQMTNMETGDLEHAQSLIIKN